MKFFRKNKSFRPRERGKKGLKNLQTVKTLAGRTQSYGTGPGKARKQPMTVSAQFQQSLHSLMDTLNQANPFFIRCIKSNSKKNPNEFDEETVQRQLRYTGMLETVRIRQAGFNVRLAYEEFIQLYRMLLPNGLISSQSDVRDFLLTLNLNKDNYQLGKTKVFLRESEKIKLDIELHQQIITSITTIQKWFRACLERRKFLRIKNAVVQIQSFWRMIMAQKFVNNIRCKIDAAINIQSAWRSYQQYKWFKKLKSCVISFQSRVRGNNTRKKYNELKKQMNNKLLCRTDSKLEGLILDDSILITDIKPKKIDDNNQIFTKYDNQKDPIIIDANVSSSSSSTTTKQIISPSSSLLATNRRILNSREIKNLDKFNQNDNTQRKGSLESIASFRSYESQLSVDSGELNFSSPDNLNSKPVPSARTKRTDTSASTSILNNTMSSNISLMNKRTDSLSTGGYSDSEITDGDNTPSAVQSAPPIFNTTQQSSTFICSRGDPTTTKYQQIQNSELWRRTNDYNYPDLPPASTIQKSLVTRTPNISQYSHVTEKLLEQARLERLNEATNLNMNNNDSLIYREQQQIRRLSENTNERFDNNKTTTNELNYLKRQNSEGDTINCEQTRDKEKEKKTEPDVPVRSVRRNRPGREIHSRSLVESGVGGVEKNNQTDVRNISSYVLRTINESDNNKIMKNELPSSSSSSSSVISSRTVTDWPMKNECTSYKPQQASKRIRSNTSITGLDLRRRNSDPATKISLIDDVKSSHNDITTTLNDSKLTTGLNLWKSHNTFTLAGHNFRKIARFSKEDVCICCNEKMDAFVTQGYRCNDCKQLYHVKCIQNGGVSRMPCPLITNITTSARRKSRKTSRQTYEGFKQTVTSKFSLTGTSAFSDSTDKIISDTKELALMQDFITKKIFSIEQQEEGKQQSEVDRVFKQALRKFKDDLVITYSLAIQQGVEGNIKYTDLIANFLHVMETVCKQENTRKDFPVTMGVNAFRGFMNEFMTLVKTEGPEKQSKSKRKKEKKRKQEEPIRHGNHMFQLTIINIPTACEVCTSFFLWPIERGLVCQNCKLTCHKKCYIRAVSDCGKDINNININDINYRKVFGIPLHKLDFGDGKVPLVVDRLITTIEMHGLYTEGIYRKSGVSSKVRELKMKMDEGDLEKVDFENYQVHVLAAVLKSFFRDMPEPLLTFESYDDFLHAGNLTNQHDRISTLFAILKKLPKPNFDIMERLIVHLARIALHEIDNRMSSSALAIVFAPCILRTNRTLPAQDSLQDVGRQTKCIETIVQEKLRFVRATLADISTLDKACQAATNRLSSLRSSKIFSADEFAGTSATNICKLTTDRDNDRGAGDEEEALLVGHIQTIKKEKELLTSTLPSLTRASSDDDLLLSATDLDDGSLDDLLPTSAGKFSIYIYIFY